MEAKNITTSNATITVSIDELAFLSNAINETLEALEECEFQTRTGATQEKARELLAELIKLLDQIQEERGTT